MKKTLIAISLFAALSWQTSKADDYTQIKIVGKDASQITLLNLQQLRRITFTDGNVIFLKKDSTQTSFSVDDIGMLLFPSTPTSIKLPAAAVNNPITAGTEVYTLTGSRLNATLNTLKQGVYILKQGNTSKKILIR